MKIMITGARGNFATALDRRLAPDHELVLYDLEPMGDPDKGISVQADIRDAGALTHAMRGCDAVIHTAAIDSHSSAERNAEDTYSVNVTGTHNVLRAMLLNDVKYLVYSSTEDVYGDGMRGRTVMDEYVPCVPKDIRAMTKLVGEDLCRFYSREHGFKVAILRYGCFVAADWRTAGIGRLNNWLDRDDVAQANELALGAVIAEAFGCETFLIQSQKPFVDEDWPDLVTDSRPVIDRYYPGATDLLLEHGMNVPHVHHRYDINKAVTWLGYDPQHNFEQFLSAVRRGH
jgi:nucleoside-diphosphate-sugar epimerase